MTTPAVMSFPPNYQRPHGAGGDAVPDGLVFLPAIDQTDFGEDLQALACPSLAAMDAGGDLADTGGFADPGEIIHDGDPVGIGQGTVNVFDFGGHVRFASFIARS